MAKLQADDSVTAQDVAKMLIEADQNGLIDKKEKKSNPLVASALELAPQVVAGSDGAMRELVANGIENRLRKRVGEHGAYKKAKAALGKTDLADDKFGRDVRAALMKGLNAAGLVTNRSDPKWERMPVDEMAHMLAEATADGNLDKRGMGLTAQQAIDLSSRIADGDV